MTVPKNYQTVDWNAYESLSTDAPTSIVWASTGGEGSGKSAFGLSAPQPVFVAAFDAFGMNRVGKQFKVNPDGTAKDIRISRYLFSPSEHKTEQARGDAATAVWNRFVQEYRTALRNARTILWDREDLAWELLRFASFGGQSAAPKEYGELNSEYVSLIQEAYAASVNLGLLRGIREKWVSKMDAGKGKLVAHNTGEMIADGMKKVPDHVDITLYHFWSEKDNAYMTRIDKFTEKEYKGQEFADLTFPMMATAAYPDTEESQWT